MRLRVFSARCGLLSGLMALTFVFHAGEAFAQGSITGNGPWAEFQFGTNAQARGIIYASFMRGPVPADTETGQIYVDGMTSGQSLKCGTTSPMVPQSTTRIEMANTGVVGGTPSMKNAINTDPLYESKYNATIQNPSGTTAQKSTVCAVAKPSTTPVISTWSVFCCGCEATPMGVTLIKVGNGSGCVSPLRILPIILTGPPQLEFRGAPTTNAARVIVQASVANDPGPLVQVTIPAGSPLYAPGENQDNPVSVGGRVTKALNDTGRYTAQNLHLLDSLRNDGQSLFVEVSSLDGNVPDKIELLIYHSDSPVPDPENQQEFDVGGPLGYGVQFEMVVDTGIEFHRGDADDNGKLTLTDAIRILGVLFQGQGEIHCLDAADVDDDGQVVVTDAIQILGFLFLSAGMPPPPPGPPPNACGVDPDEEHLGCVTYNNC